MTKKRCKSVTAQGEDGLNKAVNKRITSGAAVLAIGSVVAKMLGALYRVPLTNILGAEGMGMYQLIFPVYALFMVLATAGIPTALSRIVAEKRALGEPTKNISRRLCSCFSRWARFVRCSLFVLQNRLPNGKAIKTLTWVL